MAVTRLGVLSLPTGSATITAKAAEGLPPYGMRLGEFDTWRPGYGGASVLAVREGTTEHAALYADPGLTTPLPNPQTLLTLIDENGRRYGRWAQHVYTPHAVRLVINETAVTGIVRPPLYALAGENASTAVAAPRRGGTVQTLAALFDRMLFAEDFGTMAAAYGTNAVTASLTRAIAAAAAQGGGTVYLPAGDVRISAVTLPENVVLEGQGPGVTTIVADSAQAIITVAGDSAGLRNLTLDGVNLATGSIGVYGVGRVGIVLDRVEIKRFADGLLLRGASYCYWNDLSITNCVKAAQLRGDTDPSGGGLGGEIRGIHWRGGAVTLNTTSGVELVFFDDLVDGVTLDGVLIASNLGDGLLINGGRNIRVIAPQWQAETGIALLTIRDDSNLARAADNTVDHVSIEGAVIRGGKLSFDGSCANIAFIRSDIRGAAVNLTVPMEPIIFEDCIEDAEVALTGDTTKLLRVTTGDEAAVTGSTTDATPITAWSETMEPGAVGFYEAKVVAQRQDGTQWGVWWVAAGAQRPGSTMTFNLQTANFTAGATVTGATSGATGRIIAVVQSAGSGTLTLGDIDGDFRVGEQITDGDGGDARVSGALTGQAAALDGGGSTDVRSPQTSSATTYDAAFDVDGASIRLRLTGMNTHFVQWTARIHKLRT